MHIPSLLGVSRPIYGSADYTANELDLKTHVDYFRFGYKSTNKEKIPLTNLSFVKDDASGKVP